MLGLTEKRVPELRKILVEDWGFSEEAAKAIKGKDELIKAIQEAALGDLNWKFEVEEEPSMEVKEGKKEEVVDGDTPSYMTPEWSSYVLSLLEDNEKDGEGHPRVFGLRRLAETILGDIVDSGPIRESSSESELGPGAAWVTYQIVFDWRIQKKGDQWYDVAGMEVPRRVFRATASCSPHNMQDSRFNIFALAVSETRAEARCLKRALGITCVTAEEKGMATFSEVPTSAEWSETDRISAPLLIAIKTKCQSLNINLDKLVQKETNQKTVELLTKADGQALIQLLDGFQRDLDSIPQEIRS